ncbi:uncharacterized protein VTP21DRAFT_7744 [Calcarisporiella thermophila]|uniref:uncharacterized protein n=1 Tax=Calcarisporiella thermophila TaxID=911321 RepID=UPI0037448137
MSTQDPAPTSQKAPNREHRQKCWDFRDKYFACLDAKNVVKPVEGVCDQERQDYEKECMKSWVEYFNKRRILEYRQRAYEKLVRQQQEAEKSSS